MNKINLIPMPNCIKQNNQKCDNSKNIEYIIDCKLGKEEYKLVVDKSKITINYACNEGKFYAEKTLEQLLLDNENLPCVEIEDKPKYAFRGLLIDSSRHFVPKDKIIQTIEMMSFYKLNKLHLHLTDDQGWRVEIKKYPLLTENGSIRKATQINSKKAMENVEYGRNLFYTQEDIKEIVAFAKANCIEVIPEFDIPGHLLSAISNYPYLSCKNENVEVRTRVGVENIIGCAGNDKFYDFVKDVIDELIELFPCEYFHIGGDEVPKDKWKTCSKCQLKMKELGLKTENELQGYLTAEIANYLKSKGKRTIVWDERLGVDYPSNLVLQWWRKEKNKAQSLDWINKGENIIVSYGPYFYFDYPYSQIPLEKTYNYDPNSLNISENLDKNVLGLECCMWTEWIRDENKFNFNLYPRMQAFAEASWTNKINRNYQDFKQRLDCHLNC